ncbi:phosphopantetheine-binding protein [Brachyspira hyodysenteriae]|uniref:phosphopantetheine-binding protein n=1 Tax=Brachyspira hyodysenteriae TaxID=159 RepID=UPI00063DBD93|nr:phosphopantetheine-binding protein [Brachyspira hyodysenteriae]KLI17520.1 acyl carrier protein [Brachyspira hyodysenteriae]KLI61928.1 acyl carrier protein [Brachyspira hyodysenteriae]
MSIEDQIKQIVIESANLEGVSIEDIDTDAPLFGDELGLDSIDALEIGVAIRKKFNITFSDVEENNKQYFYSVATLAKYIRENLDNK